MIIDNIHPHQEVNQSDKNQNMLQLHQVTLDKIESFNPQENSINYNNILKKRHTKQIQKQKKGKINNNMACKILSIKNL